MKRSLVDSLPRVREIQGEYFSRVHEPIMSLDLFNLVQDALSLGWTGRRGKR